MTVAEFVAPGRCACCGMARRNYWTPDRIIDALHEWVLAHGAKPRARDWAKGTADHPASTTVRAMFGSWNRMLLAAGFNVPVSGRDRVWTEEMIVDALLDWLLREGKWPSYRDWLYSPAENEPGRPTAWLVRHRFGSWGAALVKAGRTASVSGRRWIEHDGEYVEPRCSGCGTELDNHTEGCATCWDRFRARRRRAEKEVSYARAA